MSLFRRRLGLYSFPVLPPIPATGHVSMHLERQPRPRLRVWKSDRHGLPWTWVVKVNGRPVDGGWQPTWPQALAIGCAALERHTLRRTVA